MLAGTRWGRQYAVIVALLWVGYSAQLAALPINSPTAVTWLQVPVASQQDSHGAIAEPSALAFAYRLDAHRVLVTLPGNQILRLDAEGVDIPRLWLAERPGTYRETPWHRTNLPHTVIMGEVAPARRTLILQFPQLLPPNIGTRLTAGRLDAESGADRVFSLATQSLRADGKKYWRLSAGQALELSVTANTPLEIESRVELAGRSDTADYQLTTQWHQQPPVTAVFNGRNLITTETTSCARISARPQYLQLDPQAEPGRLTLRADRDLLIRVTSAGSGRYLLDINRRTLIPGMNIVGHRTTQTLNLALPNATVWPVQERQLYTRVRALLNNQHREGGLSALALIDNYLVHTASAHMQALRNTVWERATLYRDLQPEHPPSAPVLLRYAPINLPGENLAKSSGYFYPLHNPLSFALRALPERSFARVAFSALAMASAVEFAEVRVTFDNGAATTLLLDLSLKQDTPLREGIASVFDGALEIAAHSVEIPVPTGVKSMRIEQLNGAPLIAAAEHRNSRAFALSELEFATLLGTDRQLLREVFMVGLRNGGTQRKNLPLDTADAPAAVTEQQELITHHWRPLWRYLDEQRLRFSRELGTSTQKSGPPPTANGMQAFAALTARKDWDGLLSAAHPLAERGTAEQRRAAVPARDMALKHLGEHRTAEHFLKLALQDTDTGVREFAVRTLAQQYRNNQEEAALVGLYTYLTLQPQGDMYLERLADALLATGRVLDHLQLLSISTEQPEKLLDAALTAGWWRIFERNLTALPPLQAEHWMAMRALHHGDFDGAAAHWRSAVQPEQATYALRGKELLDNVYRAQPGATQAWFDWAGQLPGTRGWQELPASLVFAVPTYIDNPRHGIRQKVYRAAAGQSIPVTVHGPATLKLTTRSVMPVGKPDQLKDWLKIEGGDSAVLAPLQNTLLSDRHLEDGSALSTAESALVHLAAGTHHLRIEPQQYGAVVALKVHSPFMSDGPLPDPQVTALLGASAPVKPSSLRYQWLQRYLAQQECPTPQTPRSLKLSTLFDPEQRLSVYPAPTSGEGTPFGGAQLAEQAQPVTPVSALTELAARTETLTDDQLYSFTLSTLWHQQQRTLSDELSAALLTSAYHRGAHIPKLARLYRSTVDRYDWQNLTSVRSSAGVRKFSEESDHYQSPELRRDLFLKGSATGISHLLGHTKKVALGYNNIQPATLELQFRQLLLPGKVLPGANIMLDVDGTRRTLDVAGDGSRRSVRLNMLPGQHRIHFSLVTSHPQIQVALSLTETYASGSEQVIRNPQLPYFVASPGAPVTITVQGPTIVRVDRKIGSRTVSTYQPVLAGIKTLTFAAPDNQTSGFYRLYQLRHAPGKNVENRYVYTQPQLSDPLLDSTSQQLHWPDEIDGYVLDDAQDGTSEVAMDSGNATWSTTLEAGQLRQSEEDSAQGLTPFYTEQNVSRRRFYEELALYVRTDLLRRDYDGEIDTLLGARQWIDWEPRDSDLSLGLYGHYYTQTVAEQGGDNRNHTLYLSTNGTYRTTITPTLYNRVQIKAFQYWLSLDRSDVIALNSVDPELFSSYKDDHPNGWDFSDRLTFSYWRDNRIYVEGELRSNGLGNPTDLDFSGVALGVDQLVGDFTLGGTIHRRRYSNDNDRGQDSHTTRLGLYVDWQRWRNKYGLDVRLNSNIDVGNGDTAWMLSGTWYFHNNRFLRDFRPQETSFRNHREERFVPAGNNSVLTPMP